MKDHKYAARMEKGEREDLKNRKGWKVCFCHAEVKLMTDNQCQIANSSTQHN